MASEKGYTEHGDAQNNPLDIDALCQENDSGRNAPALSRPESPSDNNHAAAAPTVMSAGSHNFTDDQPPSASRRRTLNPQEAQQDPSLAEAGRQPAFHGTQEREVQVFRLPTRPSPSHLRTRPSQAAPTENRNHNGIRATDSNGNPLPLLTELPTFLNAGRHPQQNDDNSIEGVMMPTMCAPRRSQAGQNHSNAPAAAAGQQHNSLDDANEMQTVHHTPGGRRGRDRTAAATATPQHHNAYTELLRANAAAAAAALAAAVAQQRRGRGNPPINTETAGTHQHTPQRREILSPHAPAAAAATPQQERGASPARSGQRTRRRNLPIDTEATSIHQQRQETPSSNTAAAAAAATPQQERGTSPARGERRTRRRNHTAANTPPLSHGREYPQIPQNVANVLDTNQQITQRQDDAGCGCFGGNSNSNKKSSGCIML